MVTVKDLEKQRAAIDAQIAKKKAEAVERIKVEMRELGISAADLTRAGAARVKATSALPVKYRDKAGNTWTGIGQRPRWLRAAILGGATLDQFAVKSK